MRKFLIAAVALLLFAGLTAESCETTTNSTPDKAATESADSGSSSDNDSSADAESNPDVATVGDTLTLHDQDGNEFEVTLNKVIDPVVAGEYDEPSSGHRFVGVKMSIRNKSDATYDDSPSNGTALIDTRDEQYDSTILSEGQCVENSSMKIAPGDRRKFCVAFEIPERRNLAKLQFALDSGFSDENGEWDLR